VAGIFDRPKEKEKNKRKPWTCRLVLVFKPTIDAGRAPACMQQQRNKLLLCRFRTLALDIYRIVVVLVVGVVVVGSFSLVCCMFCDKVYFTPKGRKEEEPSPKRRDAKGNQPPKTKARPGTTTLYTLYTLYSRTSHCTIASRLPH
jgi:hypothetical protein